MCYHYLLVKTYKDVEKSVYKYFIKICDEKNKHQNVLLDFVGGRNYFYMTNADEVNGAINDYVCLLLLLV